MDFAISKPAERLMGLVDGGIVSVWDARRVAALTPATRLLLAAIVDQFGDRSAAAQGLTSSITSLHKLCTSSDHLYLAAHSGKSNAVTVLGFLRVGTKQLWVCPPGGRCLEKVVTPSVLDVYVHEHVQRTCVGRTLFNAFLAAEGVAPASLAYDLPSPKLISFLACHYGLHNPISRPNRYCVFPGFFETQDANRGSDSSSSAYTQTQQARCAPSSCLESVAAPLLTAGTQRSSIRSVGAQQQPAATTAASACPLTSNIRMSRSPVPAVAPRAASASEHASPSALAPLMGGGTRPASHIDGHTAASTARRSSTLHSMLRQPSLGSAAWLGGAPLGAARARALVQRGGDGARSCLQW